MKKSARKSGSRRMLSALSKSAGQVELDAADDEEDRDEEPEADPLELQSHRLRSLALRDETDDDPGREGTEHDVEPELLGQEDQRDEDQHREPHRELPARVHGAFHRAHDTAGSRTQRDDAEPEADHRKRDQDHGVESWSGRLAEEERDRDDRSELARHPCRNRVGPERGIELAGIPEDRHERADRGRRQRDADQQASELTKPVACRTPAIENASASEKSQPQTASFAGRPRI